MNDQVSHDDDEYEEIMTCELFPSLFLKANINLLS